MHEAEPIIARARAWRGDQLALATVVETWGSAPRPRGSHMLVNADGRFEGSVSGGCVEGAVLAAAADVIRSGTPQQLRYGIADAAAWEVGLPCGGEIALLVQPVGDRGFPPALFDRIVADNEAGITTRVVTDLTSGRSWASAADEGGFVNRYPPPRRLLIVGAVQIAQSLATLARTTGFNVTVIDPRDRFRTAERFPDVALDGRWPDEAVVAAAPDAATAIVTLSHDIKIDDPALGAALRTPAFYIGALGSRRSHAARVERLAALGFAPEALTRIDGPAGLPIGAIGAAEIALSIAAKLVATLRAGRPDEAPAHSAPTSCRA